MTKLLILLLTIFIATGCQTSGGGAEGGGIVAGHTVVDNKFTLATPNNVTYLAGQTINFYLSFPLNVVVTGTPKLSLTIGSTAVDANFTSVSSNILTFQYVVQSADFDNNGIAVSATLNKNGGTVVFNGSTETSTVIQVPSLSTVQVNGPAGAAPVASNITPAAFNEDTSSTVTLSYTDAESDLATSCTVGGLNKVTVTTACACAAGVCTVGITGATNQNGAAFFTYTVTAAGQTSNTATASFTLTPVADAPIANNITPAAFNEDAISTITLSYSDGEGDLATACTTSALTNVTVTTPCSCAIGVCTVSVQGTANYSGAASFGYTVTANAQTSNTATATLAITAVNDAPVAANITPAAFNEDIQSVITLSYTDTESSLATACSLTGLTNVSITQACACNGAGVCTVGVTGSPLNRNGAASFNYTVTAGGQASNSASSTLTITPVDDAPVASNITPATFPKNSQSVMTLAYTDVESDLAATCSLSALSNVTVTQACACAGGVCTVGVTGTSNYVGTAGFSYTVTANTLTSNSATSTFIISNGTPPVASNITPAAFNEDVQSVITLSYTDADSDQATTCTTSALSNITVTQACACAAGVCTVGVTGTPLNYNGAAGFSYTVTAAGEVSNSATATLSITAVDDAPVAANITPSSIPRNVQGIITLSYTDVESDLATTCSISALSNVTVTQVCACNGAGVCTVGVTGTSNYVGTASFNYTVNANSAVSNSASSTFTIANNAPVASNITPAAFNEDVQSIITLSYTDSESDLASSCAITSPTNVTVTQACACSGGGVCTVGVTGTSNYNGAGASFNYTVTAVGDLSNSASATLSITAVDDAPLATNITPASFPKNTQSVMTLAYTDVESDLATSCSISGLSNVTVTQACACAAGTCTVGVTGTLNYTGSASFNYTVTANSLASNSASSTFTITNTPPVAANITPAAFNEDVQGVITLSYTDAESDLATACAITAPTNVTVTQACACTGGGVCTVGVTGTPLNRNGAASFNYTVTAGGQASNSASATLSITAVDDAPVATNITPASFPKNSQSVMTLAYTDVESHLATSCSISGLSNVTVTQACACAAGACTVGVTGTSNYVGSASFNYTVTANGLTSNSASSTFTITNTPPVANNITPAAFNEDVQGVITLSYTDTESDVATVCAITAPTNVTVTQACACAAGTCTVGVTGSPLNRNGAASFNYTVTAAGDVSNSATATLSITPVDDAPVATNITPASFAKNTQSVMTLTYTDVESNLATTCSTSGLSNVTVTQACACSSGTCTVGVTGTAGYAGSAGFNFTVTANTLTSNSASSSFTITNTAPIASNINPPVFNEDTQSVITLSYSDADGDQATTCTTSSLSDVTVTQACACAAGICTVGVTGTNNTNGAASFGYTVTAAGQTSNTATANLSITAVDDAPTGVPLTPAAFNEDTASGAISLTYSDVEGDQAATCTISALSNVTVTTACTCTLGACTVGVTGTSNYNGIASFNYTVTANGLTSAVQPANLTITSVPDAPTTANLTPAAFNEDTQSVITLTHTVVGGDTATACTVNTLSNITITQACACAAGVCTVGVTGTANYNGSASFNWFVTATSANSTTRSAALTITAVDDAATLSAITAKTTTVNTASSAIAFTFTDVDGAVCTTARLSMTSSDTTIVPNANVVFAGSAPNCTAVITPASEKSGPVTITITATDGGLPNKTTAFTLTVNGAVLQWSTTANVNYNFHDFFTPGANTTFAVRIRNIGNIASGTVTITDPGNTPRIDPSVTSCAAIAAGSFCSLNLVWTNTGGGGSGLKTETLTATHASGASTNAIAVQGTK